MPDPELPQDIAVDKSHCQHEPLEIFRPGSQSPWSDDPMALIALLRGGGAAVLKVRVCRHCQVVYSTVENWPTPTHELEAENDRLREELDALKSAAQQPAETGASTDAS